MGQFYVIVLTPGGSFLGYRNYINEKKYEMLYFLEIDRGTERLQIIHDKVTGYKIYKDEKFHQNFGKFDDFLVLFQCNSKTRAENIRKNLIDHDGASFVWTTHHKAVDENTLLKAPIWQDDQFNMCQVLKT